MRVSVTRVAVVGLGAMGSRVARRFLDAGHAVTVWNRSPDAVEPLAALGARRADSPADAARAAEAVVTMVADPAALQAVTEGPAGVTAGLAAESTLIEMSTVGPHAVARLAEVVPEEAGLLDAPVLGSLPEAESGDLRVFVGGPEPLAQRWLPLLSAVGSPLHVGPLGTGAAAKLVANSTLFGVLGVLGEAIALAEGLGLSRSAAFEVRAATPLGAQAKRRRPSVETGEYKTRFRLTLARKDADLIAEAVREAGLDLRVAAAAASYLREAEAAGWGERDYSAVLARILAGA